MSPHSGWRLTIANSSSVSGPGFLRIASGTESLPMSWTSAPVASARSRLPVKPELLAHLNGAQRDPARVLLGVLVLLGEAEGERADVRAEERLLGGDEIGSGERRRRAGATAPCAEGRARPELPTTMIPSSSKTWPSHQPSSM